ncbi:hypothetical protein [uncultured Methanolobus sp.]|uniref:hypothetical protein n=1 Tax=uncultured Methanolobus sp. TaxID=218300 RepID=UPI0029C989E9|nr:hypothetical protein [uncultured Methanolobus sp.]
MAFKEMYDKCKTKAAVAAGAIVTTIGSAAAETNSSIADVGPIIQDAATLMPYILALIISIAGVIIGMAVIRFVTGLFDNILSGMRFR